MKYRYDEVETRWPYDWAPATRGDRPWDQLDFHLDLGCGRVPKARIGIDKRLSPGATDLVIDLETLLPAALPPQQSNTGRDVMTTDHYEEVAGMYEHLPFENESIESIITHHAFEHIGPGFERLMEECYRVLEFGGVMRVIVPLFPSYAAVSEYDHKRYFMEGTMMGFCQEVGGPSIYDAFSERYNTCCFRMIDEDCSPPVAPGKEWTTEDVREIRLTLWKNGFEEPEPTPEDFLGEERWDECQSQIQARQGDAVGRADEPQGASVNWRGHIRAGFDAQDEDGDGDPSLFWQRSVDNRSGGFKFCPLKPLWPKQLTERSPGFASVCVLSYERPELLKECIGSMLAHADADFELIVHDDGSVNQELREWLLGLSADGVISTLIMNSPGWNEGQGVAMNRMAAVAKGDPIIKCDQDLIFQPGWLRKVNEVLRENMLSTIPAEPVIGALGIFKYEHDPVDFRKMFRHDWMHYDEVEDFVGSFLAMPRAAWALFGPWDEYSTAFAEDALYKAAVTREEGWCCALTKEDLAVNQGFGIGPSTVVVAEGTVQEIKQAPKIYIRQGV